MNDDKQIPSEYVSIRNIWLKGIEDCRKVISQVANIEASSDTKFNLDAGQRTVVHTVDALYLSLVDYGEALIKTDVDKWKDKNYWPEHEKIWSKRTKKEKTGFAGFDDEDEENENNLSIDEKWWGTFKLSKRLYQAIIQVLNKYGMLFEEQPRGYSNVKMAEIVEGEKQNE